MTGCLCVRKRSLNSGDWPWPCLRSLRKMTCWPSSCLLGWNGVDATAVISMLRSASGRMVIISSGVGCVLRMRERRFLSLVSRGNIIYVP